MGNIRWAGEMGGFSDSVCSGEVACTGDALRIACSVCMMCWPQSCKQPEYLSVPTDTHSGFGS